MKSIENKVKKILEELKTSYTEKAELNLKHGLDYMDIFLSVYTKTQRIRNINQWEEKELNRQRNKTLSNKIGSFHEKLLSSFPDWEQVSNLRKKNKNKYNKYKGLDIINEKLKIACEIKNKHNSINAGSLREIVRGLHNFKQKNKKWKVYLVFMLPKPNSILACNGEDKKAKIPYISGEKIYEIITKDKLFYRKVITKIFPKLLNLSKKDTKKIEELYNKIYKLK